MPNWVENKLTVEGSKEEITAFVNKARGTPQSYKLTEKEVNMYKRMKQDPPKPVEEPFCFNQFCPIPGKVLEVGYSPTGHDWEVEHWGCKWGAVDADVNGPFRKGKRMVVEFTFNTAWTPPEKLLDKIAADHPTLKFSLRYKEEQENYKGTTTWKEGKREDEDTEDGDH